MICFLLSLYLLCINLHVFVLSGWICGGDCFGAWFWGPHGANGWYSSEALPTDQVALHRAFVDYRPLSIIKLAPTQAAWCGCAYADGPPQCHRTPPCIMTLKGQQATKLRHTQHRWMRTRKKPHKMHSSDTCSWTDHWSQRSSLSFSLSHATRTHLHTSCYCLYISACNWHWRCLWCDLSKKEQKKKIKWKRDCLFLQVCSVLTPLLQFGSRPLVN